jgi:hypothetical protein
MRSIRDCAPTCETVEALGDADSTSAPRVPHTSVGAKTVAKYLGDAKRHCRRAAELNLRSGPTAGVGAAVRQSREALDLVSWVCDYAGGER